MKGDSFFVTKLASFFRNNGTLGLPNSSGLMLIVNARTGNLDTLLLDNGYLTGIRTAAAGAVAAKYLSREDSSKAAIIGAGKQARLQLRALKLVRNIKSSSVWSHNDASSEEFAVSMTEELGIPISVSQSIGSAVREADIVVTTTPSCEALIQSGDLKPGTHVTAIGSDAPGKTEISPQAVAQANHYICDSYQQSKILGELEFVQNANTIDIIELGDVITEKYQFRRKDDDISICDLTGLGIQDTEIALLAKSLSNNFILLDRDPEELQ
jgi:ornithine cyclodeaminase